MDKIDFVVTWVDGSDPKWRTEKRKYESSKDGLDDLIPIEDDANDDCRFRDSGLLRYWFRSVESFAPWVNKVFFITCGQRPYWLNTHHPKIVCLNHSDYIPEDYLPTFNSNTIELNLHRIKDLSEKFILFNDDVFLLRPVTPDFFFHDNNPVLVSTLRYPSNLGINNWSHVALNDFCILNQNHSLGDSIWHNRNKWFSISELGLKKAFRNLICYIANDTLPVGNYGHIAQPNLKSTICDIWQKCYTDLNRASMHKFRSDDQVNQWLFCAWNQAIGRFFPGKLENRGRRYPIDPTGVDWICRVVSEQMMPQVCLNDSNLNTEPEVCFQRLISAFNCILPNKSSFEIE